jgi:hypothetical protein
VGDTLSPMSRQRTVSVRSRRAAGAWWAIAATVAVAVTATAGCGGSGGKAASAASGSATPSRTATSAAPPGASARSREASAHEVLASEGALTATLHVGGGLHRPRVGERWPISFAVRSAGKAARAAVAYEYLFAGAVVAHRSHYRFLGVFHDVFQWPASAVGYPLTFRAVITSSGKTLDLDYPVQVRH